MRPISEPQDLLRHPLNAVFGAESHVRILRYLALAGGPAGATEIGVRTKISAPGVRKALSKLVAAGVVLRKGTGRSFQYELNRATRLGTAIVALYDAEGRRHHDLVRRLREVAERSGPAPRSVWIQDSPVEPGASMTVGVLHSPRELGPYLRDLRLQLAEVEREFELTIELAGYTVADLPDQRPAVEQLIAGTPLPATRSNRFAVTADGSHAALDARAHERAKLVSSMIERDPILVPKAKEWIDRLLEQGPGMADADLREWRSVLDTYSLPRLATFVKSSTPRAERLRQSSPFLPVLTNDQRRELEEKAP